MMQHTNNTGYGWITPDLQVHHVSDSTELVNMLHQLVPDITRVYNMTHVHDHHFYWNMFKRVYQQGYIRFCRSGGVLACEGADQSAWERSRDTCHRLASQLTSRSKPLTCKWFDASMQQPMSPEHQLMFPSQ